MAQITVTHEFAIGDRVHRITMPSTAEYTKIHRITGIHFSRVAASGACDEVSYDIVEEGNETNETGILEVQLELYQSGGA